MGCAAGLRATKGSSGQASAKPGSHARRPPPCPRAAHLRHELKQLRAAAGFLRGRSGNERTRAPPYTYDPRLVAPGTQSWHEWRNRRGDDASREQRLAVEEQRAQMMVEHVAASAQRPEGFASLSAEARQVGAPAA